MIWHIFKKDWKLLWPLVAMVAALHILNATMWLMLGYFGEPESIRRIASQFIIAVVLGIFALIVTVVHQDRLPGDRQDWLVRPIRRRDLVFAKLLFVLAAVHGPILIVDLVNCMGMGLPFWYSLSAAMSRNVYLLVTVSLPAFGLAAMTSTIIEFVGGLLTIVLGVTIFEIAVQTIAPNNGVGTFADSYALLDFQLWSAIALAASLVIISLQYLRRATMPARAVALGALLLAFVLSASISWASAFAFMGWLSSDPAAAKAVAISFDPGLGKMVLKPNAINPVNAVWLPLHITGIEPNSVLLEDRAAIRIIGSKGTVLYSGPTSPPPNADQAGVGSIDDFPTKTAAGPDARIHQLIILPRKVYDTVRSQPVRLEVDYLLTVTQVAASDTIMALGSDKQVANLGRCKTRMDDDGDEVELGCVGDFDRATFTCFNAFLENPVTAKRNPAFNPCFKVYLPYNAHFIPNPMGYLRLNFNFRDPRGLMNYAVDGSQLAEAQVSLKAYKPVAHFTRHLVIPEIRLGDWQADTQAMASSPATALPPGK